MNYIGEKLAVIRGDIQRFSPYPDKVRVVAVTKRFPVDVMTIAAEAGITAFGENRIQEAKAKFSSEPFSGIEKHFIGPIQSNKVHHLLNYFDWLHSLDRIKTAKLLSGKHSSLKVLIQVNTSNEKSKNGLSPDELFSFIDQLNKTTPDLQIKGLMTMGPLTSNTDWIRRSFILLRTLKEKLKEWQTDSFSFEELSMGMTNDYKIALEEGATIIRIGEGLFGQRPEET